MRTKKALKQKKKKTMNNILLSRVRHMQYQVYNQGTGSLIAEATRKNIQLCQMIFILTFPGKSRCFIVIKFFQYGGYFTIRIAFCIVIKPNDLKSFRMI